MVHATAITPERSGGTVALAALCTAAALAVLALPTASRAQVAPRPDAAPAPVMVAVTPASRDTVNGPATVTDGKASQAPIRELSTDRPDKTESPYTVPRGHWQIESDAWTWTRSVADGVLTQTQSLSAMNIKFGFSHRADVQFVFEPFVKTSVRAADGSRSVSRSAGDLTGRLKVNFFGNDGGRVAFGAMPFVTLTTDDADRRRVAGGIILPLGVELAEGWDLGTMLETDVDPVAGRGHRVTWVHSVTVGHDLGGNVGMYGEVFNAYTPSLGTGKWLSTVDFGVTWQLRPSVQLDAGINIGTTSTADKRNVFVGWTIRF